MVIKLAWRNLGRNRLRSSIMLCAMAIGLLSVMLMMGFMQGLGQSMVKNAIAWQTSHLQIHQVDYSGDPTLEKTIPQLVQLQSAMTNLPSIHAVSERLLVEGMAASARSSRGVVIRGVDASNEARVTPIKSHLVAGAWLDDIGRNPVVVSQKTAERLKLQLGSKVVLSFSDIDGEMTGGAFRVRGIFQSPSGTFDEMNLFVRRSDLQPLTGISRSPTGPYSAHEIAILLDEQGQIKAQQQMLAQAVSRFDLNQQIDVAHWQQIEPLIAAVLDQMAVSNFVMLLIFVIALSFGLVNIMLMSVFERTREFGVLMAVGMAKSRIFGLIVIETLLLALLGCFVGVLLAWGTLAWLGHVGLSLSMMADGLSAYAMDSHIYPSLDGAQYQMVVLTVLIAALLAAIYPARQILKCHPVEAMADKH